MYVIMPDYFNFYFASVLADYLLADLVFGCGIRHCYAAQRLSQLGLWNSLIHSSSR